MPALDVLPELRLGLSPPRHQLRLRLGTHRGEFLGYPATGRPFAMRSIDIWRVERGRFVEHWDELNTLEFFTQVGAVAAPGAGRRA